MKADSKKDDIYLTAAVQLEDETEPINLGFDNFNSTEKVIQRMTPSIRINDGTIPVTSMRTFFKDSPDKSVKKSKGGPSSVISRGNRTSSQIMKEVDFSATGGLPPKISSN